MKEVPLKNMGLARGSDSVLDGTSVHMQPLDDTSILLPNINGIGLPMNEKGFPV